MYKHTLEVHNEYLAKEQALPQNSTAVGNGVELDLRGAMGGVELVAICTSQISLADTKSLTVQLQQKDDGEAYAEMHTLVNLTATGALTLPKGSVLGRFVVPSDVKEFTRATLITTDAGAVGAISIVPTYLPR